MVDPDEGWNCVLALGFDNAPLSSHTEGRIQTLVHKSIVDQNANCTAVNIPETESG
jgi:hypothetical protein